VPSKTEKQKRTMAAAAHDPAFAKKMGIPQSVAREFFEADHKKRKAKKSLVGKHGRSLIGSA
jgi:hypothetical protein